MNLPKLSEKDILIDPKRKQEVIDPPYPGCPMCRHLIKADTYRADDDESRPWTCKAFPDGIPLGIALHEDRHDEEYPGDGGIRYEPKLLKDPGQKIGKYLDWEGNAFDAETLKHLKYDSEIR
jgi:hypothetical protein